MYLNKNEISKALEKICEERRTFVNKNDKEIFAFDGTDKKLCAAVPIITSGDIIGCVVLLEN